MTTRSERPSSVRAKTTLPSRRTFRWPYCWSACSTKSAISVSLPLTDSTSINARSSWTTSPSMSRGEDTSGTLQRR